MTRRLPAFVVICAVALAAAAAQPAPKVTNDAMFRVAYEAKLIVSGDEEDEKLDANAAFDYTWKRDGNTRTLLLDSLTIKMVADGEEMLNAKMSRAGLFGTIEGKKSDVKFEDAPQERKKMLTDTFGTPICKIEVDAVGKEVKRTVVAGRGAIAVFGSALTGNCTTFHPWYAPDEDEWRADVEISAGESVAKGVVTYKKAAGGKAGQQNVKLTGTLSADGQKDRDGDVIKDSKYTVSGDQTYDRTRKEWIAGKMTMDMSFKLTRNDKEFAAAKGTMVATFEMLPEKKE